jgi:hypothetical protein
MRRVDSATAAAVTLLALTSAYFVIDNYVPLYPWNNLTEAGPQLGSTLSMVIPYTVTAAALLARWRWPAVFMAGYCWVLLAWHCRSLPSTRPICSVHPPPGTASTATKRRPSCCRGSTTTT